MIGERNMKKEKSKFIFLKYLLMIFKVIFWVSITILSLGFAYNLIPINSSEEYYKDDLQLMQEWKEKQKNNKKN